MAKLENIVYDSFYTYAGMVLADRAIVDVRDCLKPSPRVLLYNQYRSKNFSNKEFVKSAALVGEALKTFYYHSDSSCYQMYCRMAAPYAMRYPLNEFHGNYGALSEGGQPAAMRYTEMRLSPLSTNYLFSGLNHNAIAEWRDNFDETDQSPRCLPSIGYYNICNGTVGLGIGVSSSIPQFNLKEVNSALIKLIQDPDCSDDEIYCPPDFATGGTIINADEVRKSVLSGTGAACCVRSTITYNAEAHELMVSDLPFGVYSSTVVEQVKKLLAENEEYGITSIYDNSSDSAEIVFGLDKDANPATMIHKLYKDTSLEDYFSINMVMLEDGRFPRVFGWREACQAYIKHIRQCKRREIQFDLDTLIARNHILEGLLTSIAHIDEVVKIIRGSQSAAQAKTALMEKFGLDEPQAKAILDLKLQRLANMEAIKVENEYNENAAKIDNLNDILGDQKKVDGLLIAALTEVMNKFGDARRTKLENFSKESGGIPEEDIMIICDEKTVRVAKRKAKTAMTISSLSSLLFITENGKMYRLPITRVIKEGSVNYIKALKIDSPVIFTVDLGRVSISKYWALATKDGFVKKVSVDEYNYLGRQGSKITKLKDGDSLIKCGLVSSDDENFKISSDVKIRAKKIKTASKTSLGAKIK